MHPIKALHDLGHPDPWPLRDIPPQIRAPRGWVYDLATGKRLLTLPPKRFFPWRALGGTALATSLAYLGVKCLAPDTFHKLDLQLEAAKRRIYASLLQFYYGFFPGYANALAGLTGTSPTEIAEQQMMASASQVAAPMPSLSSEILALEKLKGRSRPRLERAHGVILLSPPRPRPAPDATPPYKETVAIHDTKTGWTWGWTWMVHLLTDPRHGSYDHEAALRVVADPHPTLSNLLSHVHRNIVGQEAGQSPRPALVPAAAVLQDTPSLPLFPEMPPTVSAIAISEEGELMVGALSHDFRVAVKRRGSAAQTITDPRFNAAVLGHRRDPSMGFASFIPPIAPLQEGDELTITSPSGAHVHYTYRSAAHDGAAHGTGHGLIPLDLDAQEGAGEVIQGNDCSPLHFHLTGGGTATLSTWRGAIRKENADAGLVDPGSQIAIVADGVGILWGDRASRFAVGYLHAALQTAPEEEDPLATAILGTHAAMQSRSELGEVGASTTAVVMTEDRVASVGDSYYAVWRRGPDGHYKLVARIRPNHLGISWLQGLGLLSPTELMEESAPGSHTLNAWLGGSPGDSLRAVRYPLFIGDHTFLSTQIKDLPRLDNPNKRLGPLQEGDYELAGSDGYYLPREDVQEILDTSATEKEAHHRLMALIKERQRIVVAAIQNQKSTSGSVRLFYITDPKIRLLHGRWIDSEIGNIYGIPFGVDPHSLVKKHSDGTDDYGPLMPYLVDHVPLDNVVLYSRRRGRPISAP